MNLYPSERGLNKSFQVFIIWHWFQLIESLINFKIETIYRTDYTAYAGCKEANLDFAIYQQPKYRAVCN